MIWIEHLTRRLANKAQLYVYLFDEHSSAPRGTDLRPGKPGDLRLWHLT
jgi:hypothetical protein